MYNLIKQMDLNDAMAVKIVCWKLSTARDRIM